MHLSQLIGAPVLDALGRRIGTLRDVLARPTAREAVVTGAVLALPDHREVFVPGAELRAVTPEAVRVAGSAAPAEASPAETDLRLAAEVLDRRVVDLRTRRLRRVSDVEIGAGAEGLAAIAVDCGVAGILRRVASRNRLVGRLAGAGLRIPWADIEILRDDEPARYEKLERLHPADIADIVEDLGVGQGSDLLEHLAPETAADALSEVEPELSGAIVEGLASDAAADMLEDMPADDAADILADLPEDVQDDILEDMEEPERRAVEELLLHDDDTAGGVMTREFLTVDSGATVGEATARWRARARDVKAATYVYVVDAAGRLVGRLTQGALLEAGGTPVAAAMTPIRARASVDTAMEDVAESLAKYDLLALPVTGGDERLLGVVTIEDVLEFLLAKAGKRRAKRRYL